MDEGFLMAQGYSSRDPVRLIPEEMVPLVLTGLRVIQRALTREQVSGQDIPTVSRLCAPDDPIEQKAVDVYVSLLISVIENPNAWSVESSHIEEQIKNYGLSWYQMVLESARRTHAIRTKSVRAGQESSPPPIEFALAMSLKEDVISQQDSRDRADAGDVGQAQELLERLKTIGYNLDLGNVYGRSTNEIAQFCEPDDLIKRMLLITFIRSTLRQADDFKAIFNRLQHYAKLYNESNQD